MQLNLILNVWSIRSQYHEDCCGQMLEDDVSISRLFMFYSLLNILLFD